MPAGRGVSACKHGRSRRLLLGVEAGDDLAEVLRLEGLVLGGVGVVETRQHGAFEVNVQQPLGALDGLPWQLR